MNDPRSTSKASATKLLAVALGSAFFIMSVFSISVIADQPGLVPTAVQGKPAAAADQTNISNIGDWVASDPGNNTASSISNITFNALYRPLKIFFYDDYEEDSYSGSLREYLISKGHTVTYTHDDVGDINVATTYPDYDVIVAEHTCGGQTLTGLQQWFQMGKGYVALIGSQMYNDPPQDDYIMNLLGVGQDGNSGSGWSPSQFNWVQPAHQIRTYPNSAWSINSLPTGQYQYCVNIINGQTIINAPSGAVLQTREGVEGFGRIAYWGSNYHSSERTNTNLRQFVENMIVWAAPGDTYTVPVVEPQQTLQQEQAPATIPKPEKTVDDSWIGWVVMVAFGIVVLYAIGVIIPPPGRRREEEGKKPQTPESKPPEPPKAP